MLKEKRPRYSTAVCIKGFILLHNTHTHTFPPELLNQLDRLDPLKSGWTHRILKSIVHTQTHSCSLTFTTHCWFSPSCQNVSTETEMVLFIILATHPKQRGKCKWGRVGFEKRRPREELKGLGIKGALRWQWKCPSICLHLRWHCSAFCNCVPSRPFPVPFFVLFIFYIYIL